MSDLVTGIVVLLAAVAALLGYGARQRAKGRREQIMRDLRESTERVRKGSDAARKLRGADRRDLVDRLRENDGRWR